MAKIVVTFRVNKAEREVMIDDEMRMKDFVSKLGGERKIRVTKIRVPTRRDLLSAIPYLVQ